MTHICASTPASTNDVADDTLRGAAAIAAYIGQTERQTNHLLDQARLPAFKIGRSWHMRKSTYRDFIGRLEAKALAGIAA